MERLPLAIGRRGYVSHEARAYYILFEAGPSGLYWLDWFSMFKTDERFPDEKAARKEFKAVLTTLVDKGYLSINQALYVATDFADPGTVAPAKRRKIATKPKQQVQPTRAQLIAAIDAAIKDSSGKLAHTIANTVARRFSKTTL